MVPASTRQHPEQGTSQWKLQIVSLKPRSLIPTQMRRCKSKCHLHLGLRENAGRPPERRPSLACSAFWGGPMLGTRCSRNRSARMRLSAASSIQRGKSGMSSGAGTGIMTWAYARILHMRLIYAIGVTANICVPCEETAWMYAHRCQHREELIIKR